MTELSVPNKQILKDIYHVTSGDMYPKISFQQAHHIKNLSFLLTKLCQQYDRYYDYLHNLCLYNNEDLTQDEIQNIMVRAGFLMTKISMTEMKHQENGFFLLLNKNCSKSMVLVAKQGKIYEFDNKELEVNEISALPSRFEVYTFSPISYAEIPLSYEGLMNSKHSWCSHVFKRFKSHFIFIFFLAFVLSMLSVTIPVYILLVFDKAISGSNINSLIYLTTGIVFSLVLERIIRAMQGRTLSWVVSRVDYIINLSVFDKLMKIQSSNLENSRIADQLGRIKSFFSIRTFLTSSVFMSLIELPFTMIILLLFTYFAGWIAVVPVFIIAIFVMLAFFIRWVTKTDIVEQASLNIEKQRLILETFELSYLFRTKGLTDLRFNQLKDITSKYNAINNKISFESDIAESLSRMLISIAVILVLILGVGAVWDAAISPGMLIAGIFLIWRILLPFQSLLISSSQVENIFKTIKQFNQFMRFDNETHANLSRFSQRKRGQNILGVVEFIDVHYFFDKSHVIIKNLNIKIKPGEFISIYGASSSGRSTILKMLLGIVRPNFGKIMINGQDVKQVIPYDLRRITAYLPNKPIMFSGSIIGNLKLTNPNVSTAKVMQILHELGAIEDVKKLEKGLQTVLNRESINLLPKTFMYKLTLVRFLLMDTPLVLIDEIPTNLIGEHGLNVLLKNLEKWKGKKTIIIISRLDDVLKMSDRTIYLQPNKFPQVKDHAQNKGVYR